MAIETGTTLTGAVVKVTDYGAIVRLPGGAVGLVHISEIADTFVRDVRDYLSENDQVTVKVLGTNSRGRYELSIKQCNGATSPVERAPEVAGAAIRQAQGDGAPHRESWQAYEQRPRFERPATFEDRLSRFLKDSEERQHDLKRHLEGKRSRR